MRNVEQLVCYSKYDELNIFCSNIILHSRWGDPNHDDVNNSSMTAVNIAKGFSTIDGRATSVD